MTTVTKPRVTFADLLWVAWRRHRALIVVTAGLVAAVAVAMVLSGAPMNGSDPLATAYFRQFWRPMYVSLLFGVAIAVFWGAPLVSREYEARMSLVAWGQDVSATRWLTGQVALLGAVTTCFAAVVWLAMEIMTNSLRESSGGSIYEPFTGWFEIAPQVQIGYTLFGLALGVAAGTVTRRTVPAMAIALFGFTALRIVVLQWVRPYYLPPVHTFKAWSPPGVEYVRQMPEYALYVASGYADANGVRMEYPQVCSVAANNQRCIEDNGVAGHYAEFQPLERLGLFQWIEAGIFLVLAAGLLALAWYWVKRAHRV